MKLELAAFKGKKICVAVSGGRDSMALLHYLYKNAKEWGIELSAVNCDHKMRKNSASDSAFVKNWCGENGVALITFVAGDLALKTEAEAREWRRSCYLKAAKGVDGCGRTITSGADYIATAHHLNDNAETVLFNLARGSGLAGITGITDGCIIAKNGEEVQLIHPLISCTRAEIDAYVVENNLPYVDDETNLSDAYTRNYIRNNVLPALESAVPDAAKAIYRFSRLVAEDEKFFREEVKRRGLLKIDCDTAYIKTCEKSLFSRALMVAVKDFFGKKDYTSVQVDNLYKLCFTENGKKFEFLGLTAYSEEDGISIKKTPKNESTKEVPFLTYLCNNSSIYGGQSLEIALERDKNVENFGGKVLKFDLNAIPDTAVIRFMRSGDKFKKFGGGTKNLGDFFTDRKIPVRIRKTIPLICGGSNVLAVCGVEISDTIKITEETEKVGLIICDLKL